MGIKEEIEQYKELLYLNALKVANNTLEEAQGSGDEVSSGLLSAASSLLKLNVEAVLPKDDAGSQVGLQLQELINNEGTKK